MEGGKTMSNYGPKTYNPEERKRQHEEYINKEEAITRNHALAKKADVDVEKEINYYNSKKK